jgi:hypothetical protein
MSREDYRSETSTLAEIVEIKRYPHRFVSVGRKVMNGKVRVATALSNNMALRIARALNRHKTNEPGI